MCPIIHHSLIFLFFFFNDTATTEIYTLSLHDALPIYEIEVSRKPVAVLRVARFAVTNPLQIERDHALKRIINTTDRKSTRLNSSHGYISYAVFCLKKKKRNTQTSNSVAIASSRCDQ